MISLARVAYIVNIRADGSLLSIDAEHVETNQRWSAEFTSQCKFTSSDWKSYDLIFKNRY